MTVKEFAEKMGMSVNGLCEVTGMSRQGLNDILVKGYTAKESQKRKKAVDNLLNYATDAYSQVMEREDKIFNERLNLLQMFYNESDK